MDNSSNYNQLIDLARAMNFSIAQEPDTIPKTQHKDTTAIATLDIDSLFLMTERKAKEVEAYREQAIAYRARILKDQTKAKVDTTCFICPVGDPIQLHSVLEKSSTKPSPLGLQPVYDRDYYTHLIGTSAPVFAESPSTVSNTIKSSEVKILPRHDQGITAEWVLIPLLAVLLTAGFLKVYFQQQLSVFFRSTIFFFVSNKLTRDNSILWNRIFFFLDFVFFLSIPLLFALVVPILQSYGEFEYGAFTLALFVMMGLFGFRIFRYITSHIIGFVTNHAEVFRTLYTNQLLYTRALGVIAIPFLVILGYSNELVRPYALIIFATITSIAILFRTLRTAQVFLSRGFSLFYLILYLCALEIIPILIIYNEIFRG